MKKGSTEGRGRYLIGIDEAGRGPLAGPVAVGAFAVRSREALRRFRGVRDSKQLTEKQREEWFAAIRAAMRAGDVLYSVSYARAETIDERGLTHAVYSAVNRCLRRLEALDEACKEAEIRLDGLLSASGRYADQRTIIGGDEREQVIALASICAKVMRDRRMKRLAREFPHYGFEVHKGYGTKAHYSAIRKYGMTPLHRRSFLKKIVA
jgi:ribonuclease HII